jgi:chromosome segregation ATPase
MTQLTELQAVLEALLDDNAGLQRENRRLRAELAAAGQSMDRLKREAKERAAYADELKAEIQRLRMRGRLKAETQRLRMGRLRAELAAAGQSMDRLNEEQRPEPHDAKRGNKCP